MAVILALVCGVFGVITIGPAASPASAHICTNPVEVNVGQAVNINFGVAAEDKPVTAVDVAVPTGFELREPIGFNGWQATRDGSVAHFTGGTIKPFTCEFFTFAGTATIKGALYLDITVVNGDGSKTVYDVHDPYSPTPAMGVFAGVPIPSQGVTPGGKASSNTTALLAAAAGAVIAGGLTAAFLFSRSRRRIAR